MSEFKCEVVRVEIIAHPNADQIEIAKIGGYQSIVKKGQFVSGDLAVYLPEQAILPEWMLKEMGFWDEVRQKGHLHGAGGNRVKAIKLRGVVSQGICYPVILDSDIGLSVQREAGIGVAVTEGNDVAAFLGVVKYEPAIPSHMRGSIIGVDQTATMKYDFDNLKKMPTLFDDGESVVITEKVHGTLMCISVVPTSESNDRYYKGRVSISSKGMGAKGFVLDHADEGNLYAQCAHKHNLLEKALLMFGSASDEDGKPMFLLGEVYGKTLGGKGVQDLTYTGEPLGFAAFDMCVSGEIRGDECYCPWSIFDKFCGHFDVPTVPLLYAGPYSPSVVAFHTNGTTMLGDPKAKIAQIREGCVVKSASESPSEHYGRKIAKSVSDAYLFRKGEQTEFN